MDPDIDPRILALLPDEGGAGDWTLRPVDPVPHSRGYLATPAGASDPALFLKIYARPDPVASAEVARREHAALTHLWEYRKDQVFRTPRPVAVVVDPPALLMGFLPGTKLDTGLTRRLRHFPPPGFGALFLRRFRRLGVCLRAFSELPPPAEGAPLEEHLATCRARLTSREVLDVIGDEGVQRADDVLRRAAESIDPPRRASRSRHGDLGPWNVLRAGPALGLIDMEHYGPGFLLEDLADLFARLDRLVPLSAVPEKRLRQLKAAVARGFGTIPDADLASWPLLRMRAAIELASWEPSYEKPLDEKRAVAAFVLTAASAAASEVSTLSESKA